MKEYSIRIQELFDGKIDPQQEDQLMMQIATNDEVRYEFKQLLAIETAVKKDFSAFTPPVAATEALFGKLGMNEFASPIPSQTNLGFWSNIAKYKQAIFSSVASIALCALLFYIFDWSRLSHSQFDDSSNQNTIVKNTNTNSNSSSNSSSDVNSSTSTTLNGPAKNVAYVSSLEVENQDLKNSNVSLNDKINILSSKIDKLNAERLAVHRSINKIKEQYNQQNSAKNNVQTSQQEENSNIIKQYASFNDKLERDNQNLSVENNRLKVELLSQSNRQYDLEKQIQNENELKKQLIEEKEKLLSEKILSDKLLNTTNTQSDPKQLNPDNSGQNTNASAIQIQPYTSNTNYGFELEMKSSQYYFKDNVQIHPKEYQSFNNTAISLGYKVFDEFLMSFDYRRENFYQTYLYTKDQSEYKVEQYPNVNYYGLNLKYIPSFAKNAYFSPYLGVSSGFTSAGLVYRTYLGGEYAISQRYSILLDMEQATLNYKQDAISYSKSKYGVLFGVKYKF